MGHEPSGSSFSIWAGVFLSKQVSKFSSENKTIIIAISPLLGHESTISQKKVGCDTKVQWGHEAYRQM
jgi:hypothetical protein